MKRQSAMETAKAKLELRSVGHLSDSILAVDDARGLVPHSTLVSILGPSRELSRDIGCYL